MALTMRAGGSNALTETAVEWICFWHHSAKRGESCDHQSISLARFCTLNSVPSSSGVRMPGSFSIHTEIYTKWIFQGELDQGLTFTHAQLNDLRRFVSLPLRFSVNFVERQKRRSICNSNSCTACTLRVCIFDSVYLILLQTTRE